MLAGTYCRALKDSSVPRLMASTLSREPSTGAPSGPGKQVRTSSSLATSSGMSSYMRISSRMTPRSVSMSALSKRERRNMSPSSSAAAARLVSSART